MAALATTASAASEGSRRVRIEWQAYTPVSPAPSPPASPAVLFVDPRDAGPPVNAWTILRFFPKSSVSPRARELELAEDRLLVRALDGSGGERFRTVIPDPRVVRAEAMDEQGRMSGRVLHRRRTVFDLLLPEDPSIVELRFYHPNWTGEGWDLQDLGSPLSLVVAAGPSGGPTASPAPPPPPPPKDGHHVETVMDHGDPARRFDWVILGDGYTEGQMADYRRDVKGLVNGLFSKEPFATYLPYFNVHRVDVVSKQSGADRPDLKQYVDTALGAFFDCNGHRVVCVDDQAVNTIVGDSVPFEADQVFVLVNDKEYGGSGGSSVAVATMEARLVETALHESAHSFGRLADEYWDDNASCDDKKDPPEANASRNTRGGPPKWNHWLTGSPAASAACRTPGVPALCKGARYCPTLYRPTYNSKMRSLGMPFDPINTEQLVKSIYERVSPIDLSSPRGDGVTIDAGKSQLFTITTPRLAHSFEIAWTVDGVAQTETSTAFKLAPLNAGAHVVAVTVRDPTTLVKDDPKKFLRALRSWDVTVR